MQLQMTVPIVRCPCGYANRLQNSSQVAQVICQKCKKVLAVSADKSENSFLHMCWSVLCNHCAFAITLAEAQPDINNKCESPLNVPQFSTRCPACNRPNVHEAGKEFLAAVPAPELTFQPNPAFLQ